MGRRVTVTWQTKVGDPSLRRLVAECNDEMTIWAFAGPPVLDESDPKQIVRELGPKAVQDHRARCGSCQRAKDLLS